MNYFEKLLDRTLMFWPTEIKILHREVRSTEPYKCVSKDLVEAYLGVEKAIIANDEFAVSVMDWAIYTAAHHAMHYVNVIKPRELSSFVIRRKFESDLEKGEDTEGLYESLREAHYQNQ